jgi:hypothetical protein
MPKGGKVRVNNMSKTGKNIKIQQKREKVEQPKK